MLRIVIRLDNLVLPKAFSTQICDLCCAFLLLACLLFLQRANSLRSLVNELCLFFEASSKHSLSSLTATAWCLIHSLVTKKPLHFREEALYRGPERIRTAVEAFAELCLATRPQDPVGTRK